MRWSIAVPLILLVSLIPVTGNAYWITFVFGILIAYIVGQSWDWVAGEMGYVNLGHYLFFGIGAYVFSIALVAGWASPLAITAAILFVGFAAMLLAVPLFRLKGDYFAFATLALLPLAEVLAYNLTSITNGGDGIVLPAKQVLVQAYFVALAICIVCLLTTIKLTQSRFGYALRSIRNDEQVAETVGINIQPYKTKVLMLSAAFGAAAGSLQAWQLSYIDPVTVFGLNVALAAIAMVLFAGSGLRWGPLVGVVILASFQQWLMGNVKGYQAAIYGLIILLIGRYMPGGFLRAGWMKTTKIFSSLTKEHYEFVNNTEFDRPMVSGTKVVLPLGSVSYSSNSPLIELSNIRMQFGGNIAVNDVSLKINKGEIVGLIGPNGSGKTTLFNCISKVYEPSAGRILFDGKDLERLSRDQVANLGVGRTFQIPRPFSDLTVQENIAIPLMFGHTNYSPERALREACAFLDYVDLSDHLKARADSLSIQGKKALEFARALACRPRLLLVDEVASGLTPAEVRRFAQHIREIRDDFGITIIWVEHIFSALEQVADRVIALEQGSVIADGTLAEVVRNERVLATYLGSTSVKQERG